MEYGRERKKSREGWVEERCIGSGGFGTVTLYENKVSAWIVDNLPVHTSDTEAWPLSEWSILLNQEHNTIS